MRTIDEIMTSLGKQINAKAKQSVPPPAQIATKTVALPQWPEEVRGCPSCVLRSALFGVVRRGRRKALEGEILATWEGVTIRYTGWRLDQADLDVWLAVLHIAREYALGMRVQSSVNRLLKAVGRNTDGRSHEWLKGAIRRLTACAVEITAGHKTYWGSLIEKGCHDEETGQFAIFLNPELAALFDDVTWQDWEVRRGLNGDLAKWLQGYIASHQAIANNPHRIGLERLRELCGSETEELKKFRQQVKGAMVELNTARVVVTWRITTGDALEVVRPQRKRQLIEN